MAASHAPDAKRIGAALLLAELDAALTLLGMARASTDPETIVRARENAQQVCMTACRWLPEARLSPQQRLVVMEELTVIRHELRLVGYEC
jgi:hypothetical protein